MSLFTWLNNLIHPEPVNLAIVRRYQDANGAFVGELYLYSAVQRKFDTVTGYRMIGVSLDTLPLDIGKERTTVFALDTGNDFLVPMPPMVLRVGATEPKDNDNIRKMVRKLPRRNMTLIIQNRFIEHVLDKPNV
jgi:vacuolar-type H+-ATPase subunit F/Vma7